MRFLTSEECQAWAKTHGIPVFMKPLILDAEEVPFPVCQFRIPNDAGARVALVRELWHATGHGRPETLLWVTGWSVWPSGEHLPLATSLRRAFGEERSVFDAPGCLVGPGEDDDALSLVSLAVLFLWDIWILDGERRTALFFSHDEFGELGGHALGEVMERLRMLDALETSEES